MTFDEEGNEVAEYETTNSVAAGMEETPSWVTEDTVEVTDLDKVQRDILPVCQNVLGIIRKATIKPSADRGLKTLKIELVMPEGIDIVDPETGETRTAYVNRVVFPGFTDLLIWADPAKKTSAWYKSQQHLLPLKEFCKALGFDLKLVKINQKFCADLIGRHILFSVRHEEESSRDEHGNRVKTGLFRERIVGWKAAEEE